MDSMLIKQLQQKVALERDESAYKLLFMHFYRSLAIFAYGIVKTRETSEEVVLDVMLNIWNMKEGLSKVNNLNVYLYRATKNTSLNYVSKSAKHQFGDINNIDEGFILEKNTPEDFILKTEWKNKFAIAVRELSPKCRMVYRLIREDGFSYKEVAAIMEISENTVDRHLTRALHKLVKSMKAYLN